MSLMQENMLPTGGVSAQTGHNWKKAILDGGQGPCRRQYARELEPRSVRNQGGVGRGACGFAYGRRLH